MVIHSFTVLWAITASYGANFTFLYVDDVLTRQAVFGCFWVCLGVFSVLRIQFLKTDSLFTKGDTCEVRVCSLSVLKYQPRLFVISAATLSVI
jgi:hypothetical protein